MTAQEILQLNRAAIIKAARSHGAENLRLFGSTVQGKNKSDSDLDLLVDLSDSSSLLDMIAAKQEIEEITGCKVDLVTAASLSPHIRESILHQAVPL